MTTVLPEMAPESSRSWSRVDVYKRQTMAFATLTLSQLFHAFDVRSEETSLFRLGFFSNPAMNKAFLAGVVLQGLVLLLPPLQGAFSVVPMPLPQWGIVLGLAVTPLVVCEIEKAVRRARTGPVSYTHLILVFAPATKLPLTDLYPYLVTT